MSTTTTSLLTADTTTDTGKGSDTANGTTQAGTGATTDKVAETKTKEQATSETQPDPKATETTKVPEAAELELKFPDGVQADKELVDGFKALAKEAGLKGEHAQKVVDLYATRVKALEEQAQAEVTRQVKEWEQQARADKEFGGTAFDANLTAAKRAVEKFGGPGLKKLLADTGLGNHPELFRVFARVGKAIAEDSIAGTSTKPSPAASKEQELRALYPNSPTMFPQE